MVEEDIFKAVVYLSGSVDKQLFHQDKNCGFFNHKYFGLDGKNILSHCK